MKPATTTSTSARAVAALNLMRTIDPEFSVNQVVILLAVAAFEAQHPEESGVTLTEIARRTDIRITIVSRAMQKLSDDDRKPSGALGLLSVRTNLMNRREKLMRLTPRGKALVAGFLKHLET